MRRSEYYPDCQCNHCKDGQRRADNKHVFVESGYEGNWCRLCSEIEDHPFHIKDSERAA